MRNVVEAIGATAPPNKGMKLTKPEHNEASQLIPGVPRTMANRHERRARSGARAEKLQLNGPRATAARANN
jgi:hypothetical protein